METLNYLREYAAGFRMPDLSKIWYGQDEVDSGNNESLLIQVSITFLSYFYKRLNFSFFDQKCSFDYILLFS